MARQGYGAVGCVETTKNPIRLANALFEHGQHTTGMLVGKNADNLAQKYGLDTVTNSAFTTPFRKDYWEKVISSEYQDTDSQMGTVGAVVLIVTAALLQVDPLEGPLVRAVVGLATQRCWALGFTPTKSSVLYAAVLAIRS